MSDPRKRVVLRGLHNQGVTYKIDNSTITYDGTKANGSSVVGQAVTLSADDTVALAADGEPIEGKLDQVQADGFCGVVTDGFVELPGGVSATLTRGAGIVGAVDGSGNKGYIRAADSATAAELLVARGRIVNNGDTSKVVVDL